MLDEFSIAVDPVTTMRIEDGVPMRLLSVHRRGPDALLHYRFGG